jgi:hypothetical protein
MTLTQLRQAARKKGKLSIGTAWNVLIYDKITDADGDTWTVLTAELRTMNTRWLCA